MSPFPEGRSVSGSPDVKTIVLKPRVLRSFYRLLVTAYIIKVIFHSGLDKFSFFVLGGSGQRHES